VLIFHRVLSQPDPLFPGEVDSQQFEAIVTWLTRWFNVLPLQEAVRSLASKSLPARAACITFDDGYRDNVLNALPILQKYGATATFFIATGYLFNNRMWNDTIIEAIRHTTAESLNLEDIGAGVLQVAGDSDKRTAIDKLIKLIKYRGHQERDALAEVIAARSGATLPDDIMMNGDGVRTLHSAGMGIGAHTVDHPILRLCSETETRQQILDSRDYLEGLTGERVSLFAYPNGKPNIDYTPDQARLVEELGFEGAVSTQPGTSGAVDDRFQLRRFTPWDRSPFLFAMRLALNVRGLAA
jgi:peptidoglycan/xylan/chitin deacetylase (PgdA/CDA1 family)